MKFFNAVAAIVALVSVVFTLVSAVSSTPVTERATVTSPVSPILTAYSDCRVRKLGADWRRFDTPENHTLNRPVGLQVAH